jgi:hypothetical protein
MRATAALTHHQKVVELSERNIETHKEREEKVVW